MTAKTAGWSHEQVVLEATQIGGSVDGALARLELTQTYRNQDKSNIEATYTFPLPNRAVLLSLDVVIGSRHLCGIVVPKGDAEEQYEKALEKGNSAVLLEEIEPGLYTMNVGNLMPGERIEIRLRYAVVLTWDRNSLRLAIPMAVAPRYGSAIEAGVQPHQQLTTDLLAENSYGLEIQLVGELLTHAVVSSPTHQIEVINAEPARMVTLKQGAAWADRDFVLTFRTAEGPSSAAQFVKDSEGVICHAEFRLGNGQVRKAPRRNLKLIIDCSGSMNGDSIESAKRGALEVLHALRPDDRFTVVAFGNDQKVMSTRLLRPTPIAIEATHLWVSDLAADMGGTEMESALDAAFAIKTSDEPCDVLLITDGEVWETQSIIKSARGSRHRIFSVGVGSSPAASFLSSLSEWTGGTAAFATPGEDVALAVRRQFDRITQLRSKQVRVNWPGTTTWTTGTAENAAITTGDSVHSFACLTAEPVHPVELEIKFEDGSELKLSAAATPVASDARRHSDLGRIAATGRMKEALAVLGDKEKATQIAVEYQLQSKLTSYVLIIDRDADAATDLPKLKQISGMLAAGWGGTSAVLQEPPLCSSPIMACRDLCGVDLDTPAYLRAKVDEESPGYFSTPLKARLARVLSSVSRFKRKPAVAPSAISEDRPLPPLEFIKAINEGLINILPVRGLAIKPEALDELVALVPDQIKLLLLEAAAAGLSKEQAVVAFLTALLNSPIGQEIRPILRHRILRMWLLYPDADELCAELVAVLQGVTATGWEVAPTNQKAGNLATSQAP